METNPRGAGVSGTYNFNRWLGLTIDGSTHWGSGETTLATRIDDARFTNISLGPKITFRSAHFSPFLEALAGDHRLVPEAFHSVDKLGFMVGGGLDINLSRHIALRLLRADYVFSTYRFAPGAVPTTDIRGVRLQTGLNFMFGGGEPAVAPSAACSAQPTDVYAGEPVQITVNPSNFNPKRTLSYGYTATGGKVNGTGQTPSVDTTGLNSGAYTVTANVTDGKKGRASCAATFNVKQAQAPTISCSPNPATVQPGGSSTINSNSGSPDNRRLTYSYSASAGTISGNDASATLNTAGAQPGPITVTCNVADDRTPPLTASSTTTVTVEAPPPPPPPPPAASKVNQIEFPNLQKPWRVDNTAKAILDDVALRLQREPDSKLVIVGSQEETEHRKNLSAERAVDAKAYLTNEKGIDPSRIETRSGGTAGKVAEFWIVPAGASYSGSEVTVDENLVKAIPDHPAARRGVKK
jgi:outer membrane protein OmpA-like peptidoglycan-associated protein